MGADPQAGLETAPPLAVPARIVDVDDTGVRLLVVRDLAAHVDAGALLHDPAPPEPPYWMHLWPGGRVLARLVAEHGDWHGHRVVEPGCGLALPGIAAAVRGAAVTLTDTEAGALAFARASAALNGCALNLVRSDLRRPGIRGPFDCCLAADTTFSLPLQEALAAFLAAVLAPGGWGWCAESVRAVEPGFRRACEAHGLAVREHHLSAEEDGRRVWVRVSEVRR